MPMFFYSANKKFLNCNAFLKTSMAIKKLGQLKPIVLMAFGFADMLCSNPLYVSLIIISSVISFSNSYFLNENKLIKHIFL